MKSGSFCYTKDKNLPDDMRGQPDVGSMWTWMVLDADSQWHPNGPMALNFALTFQKSISGGFLRVGGVLGVNSTPRPQVDQPGASG